MGCFTGFHRGVEGFWKSFRGPLLRFPVKGSKRAPFESCFESSVQSSIPSRVHGSGFADLGFRGLGVSGLGFRVWVFRV